MPGLQICTICKKEKSLDKFHRDKSIPGEIRHQCKECRKEQFKKYYVKKKRENPDFYKEHNLKYHKYITVDEYNKLFNAQQGCCAICNKKEIAISRWGTVIKLSVDHDHKTGKVRGLLCMKCNHLLGQADDNIDILFKAIQYLREF